MLAAPTKEKESAQTPLHNLLMSINLVALRYRQETKHDDPVFQVKALIW